MPFTFSHPAIVLPLLNKRNRLFSATGLIIGSMTPDFESFITVDDTKIYSHTWAGLFWFDIPLALMLVILFHAVVRVALIENMPRPLAERFECCRDIHWFAWFRKHFWVVLLSLFIGILSHFLWDAFTHLDIRYPDSIHSHIKVFGKRLYKILQFGCSIIGLMAVAWFIYKLPRKKVRVSSDVKFQYWLVMLLVAVLTGVVLVINMFRGVDIYPILMLYIAISSCLLALVVVSLCYQLLVKRGR